MTTLYKLTDTTGQTHNQTQWGAGVTHTASGEGELCGPGWIHAYTDPVLALMLDPIHVDFGNKAILWEAEGKIGKTDYGLKVGTAVLTTIRKIGKPKITTAMRVRFGILCARQVCADPEWNAWAKNWLDGKDRTAGAATATARAAWAAEAATATAAEAAKAWAAAWAARAAAKAAEAAAEAAEAARAKGDLDLIALAHQAVREETP